MRVFAVVLFIVCTSLTAKASTIAVYTDRDAWLSVVRSPAQINLDGIAAPGQSVFFHTPDGLVIDDVRFVGRMETTTFCYVDCQPFSKEYRLEVRDSPGFLLGPPSYGMSTRYWTTYTDGILEIDFSGRTTAFAADFSRSAPSELPTRIHVPGGVFAPGVALMNGHLSILTVS